MLSKLKYDDCWRVIVEDDEKEEAKLHGLGSIAAQWIFVGGAVSGFNAKKDTKN